MQKKVIAVATLVIALGVATPALARAVTFDPWGQPSQTAQTSGGFDLFAWLEGVFVGHDLDADGRH